MLCRHPFIRDPTGKVLLRGPTGDFEDRINGVPFPCGQCLPCRINKRRVWTLRLMLESYFHEKCSFVTLTYDDEHLPVNDGLPVLKKRDCQLWLKRLRKWFNRPGLRYYLAGEYGSRNHRPHYHAILFGVSPEELDPEWAIYDGRSGDGKRHTPLSRTWPQGLVHVGECTRESIQYVAGYVTKKFTVKGDNYEPEFSLMSRRPGIGAYSVEEVARVLKENHLETIGARELRIEGKRWPLGRFLTSKLSLLTGHIPGSDDYIKSLTADLVSSRKEGVDFVDYLTGKDDGRFAKLSARDRIYNHREGDF